LQIPVSAADLEDGANDAGINRQALKSVFDVCNNLAQAVMEVRSQLNGEENQRVSSTRRSRSPPAALPSPRILRTRYLNANESLEGGRRGFGSSVSRELLPGRGPYSGEAKTPRYASTIGREKHGARFSSPEWRWPEKPSRAVREPWTRPGSPPLRPSQFQDRQGRPRAPSTIR
jgi:hypothetical protein